MDQENLFALAMKAALTSYSPYSHFRVGAAIECSDGAVFTGTNIENRSFGLTICAERNAIAQAVHQGHTAIVAVAVATPDSSEPVSPCGACRQVLTEFANASATVEFGPSPNKRIRTTAGELFPYDALHDLTNCSEYFKKVTIKA